MKKIILILILALALPGCSPQSSQYETGKLRIVASLFPQYDFAKQIAGDKADVSLLLPPGVESHTFDPRPSDFEKIYGSDIFVYTGKYMEPWADKVISGVEGESPIVVDASLGIEFVSVEDGADHHNHDHDHGPDPHIWLDLSNAAKMVDSISEAICVLDAENRDYYMRNTESLKNELQKLDEDIFDMVRSARKDVLVFGGKFAYIYFLNRYDIGYVTAYDSCSAETEPSVRRIAEIIDFIDNNEITCIYHEEFVDPKIARSVAEQTNVNMKLFSTLHNVTKTEFDSGMSFAELMRQNMKNVQYGLN